MSKKTENGGRHLVVDLCPADNAILNKLRVTKSDIKSVTETVEQIIRKADIKTLWL